LFQEGGNPPAIRQVRLKLGAHVGIRDLAALDDGRLLVLTGASQEQQQPALQRILLVSPSNQDVWEIDRTLLASVPIDSAEGLAVLSQQGNIVTLLVLAQQAGALRYELTLP
jgi:hypothetical protein